MNKITLSPNAIKKQNRSPRLKKKAGFNLNRDILSGVPPEWIEWNTLLKEDSRLPTLSFYKSIRDNVFSMINQSLLADYLGFHRSVLSRIEAFNTSYITGAAFIKYCYTMETMKHMKKDDVLELFSKKKKKDKFEALEDRVLSLEQQLAKLLNQDN